MVSKLLQFCLTFFWNPSKLYTCKTYMFLLTVLKLMFCDSLDLTLFYEGLPHGPIGAISQHLYVLRSHQKLGQQGTPSCPTLGHWQVHEDILHFFGAVHGYTHNIGSWYVQEAINIKFQLSSINSWNTWTQQPIDRNTRLQLATHFPGYLHSS